MSKIIRNFVREQLLDYYSNLNKTDGPMGYNRPMTYE